VSRQIPIGIGIYRAKKSMLMRMAMCQHYLARLAVTETLKVDFDRMGAHPVRQGDMDQAQVWHLRNAPERALSERI